MFKYLALFLALFLFSCSKKELPNIKVKTLDNKDVYLSQYKGKKLLMYIWSRTCVGHAEHLKELSLLAKEKKEYSIISYAVAMGVEEVIKSYEDLGIKGDFITLVDTEVKFNDYYTIVFLPSTYIFDEKGKFIASYPGLYIP